MLGENKCSLFRCRCHNSRIDYYLSFSFWITSSTFFLSFSLSVSGVQFITLSKLFGCLYLILIYNIEQKYNIVLFDEFSKLNLLQTDQIKYEESISFVHFEHLSWLHLQSWRSRRLNASVKATIQVNREMHHRLCRELRNVKFAILMFNNFLRLTLSANSSNSYHWVAFPVSWTWSCMYTIYAVQNDTALSICFCLTQKVKSCESNSLFSSVSFPLSKDARAMAKVTTELKPPNVH